MAKSRRKPVGKRKPYDPSGEPFTVNDHLGLARNLLWTAGRALEATGSNQPNMQAAGNSLMCLVTAIDHLRTVVPPEAPVKVVGVVGLPPSPALIKFAKLIIASHKESGGKSVELGSCAFSLKLE